MKIALMAGDGIGPEIMREAVRVLDVLRGEGLKIETEEALIGGAAFDAHKHLPLPPKTLDLARSADAVLFGAVGGPQYDKNFDRPLRLRRPRSWACARNATSSRTCARPTSSRNSPTPRR